MKKVVTRLALLGAAAIWLLAAAEPAMAQNDWQFPDPYFGAFQHRAAGTPEAERRYRAEIAPQEPVRLHEHRPAPSRRRWGKHRGWVSSRAVTAANPSPRKPISAAPMDQRPPTQPTPGP